MKVSRKKEAFGVGDETAHKEGTSAVSAFILLTFLLVYLKARVEEKRGFCQLPAVALDLETCLDVDERLGAWLPPFNGLSPDDGHRQFCPIHKGTHVQRG